MECFEIDERQSKSMNIAVVVGVRPDVTVTAGHDVLLCVRPESFSITPAAPADRNGIALEGTVARRAFLGDTMRYWVRVDDREWIVDQPDPGAASPLDGAVSLSVRPERVHVIAE